MDGFIVFGCGCFMGAACIYVGKMLRRQLRGGCCRSCRFCREEGCAERKKGPARPHRPG